VRIRHAHFLRLYKNCPFLAYKPTLTMGKLKYFLILLTLVNYVFVPILGSGGGGRKKVMDVRLPETITPLYYKLELIPYVEEAKNFTLNGKAWIDVNCLKATEKITLHIKNISIKKDSVTVTPIRQAELPVSEVKSGEEGGSLTIQKHEFDEDREFYNITVAPGLEQGKLYRIYIEYTGMLDDSLGGFYRSSYIDQNTKEKRYPMNNL